MPNRFTALDIETECAVKNCKDSQCSHALTPHLARITVIGTWSPQERRVFRDLSSFNAWMEPGTCFVGHHLKFDLKMLAYHGVHIPKERWVHDTSLMAVASYEKVSADYLAWYETKRKELNKSRKGNSHREAGQHSLKTLAPYFLGVPPFWEAEDHNNDEYVLKDAEYTYRLYEFLTPKLKEQGTYDFYEKKLMPWNKMFMAAEMRGVKLDMAKVEAGALEYEKKAAKVKSELDQEWRHAYAAFTQKHIREHMDEYNLKAEAAKKKIRAATPDKMEKVAQRYRELFEKAAKKIPKEINLASAPQLQWLLRDHFGLDIRKIGSVKESTDAEVLERLAAQGRKDVALLLKYREYNKLSTTYFPSYKELALNGVLHANFGLDTARTGRTNSSNPNLQNQPGHLHSLFIARPGYKIITKDLGAIEPAMICYYTEDPFLYEIISQDPGLFHSRNAVILFQEEWDVKTLKKEHPEARDAAKEFGLSVLYGAGKQRVQISMIKRGQFWPLDRCADAVRRLRDAWPGVIDFKEELDIRAVNEPITNLFGRKRYFDDGSEIYMKAFNGLIQGSASDLLLNSCYKATQEFRKKEIDAHLLMTVHDEVVFEVPEDRAEECDEIITRNMTDYDLQTALGPIKLTVEGKISDHWEK